MADKDKYADEIMSDEELDGVAGGYANEMADDSQFLNVLLRGRPGQCDRYGQWRAPYNGEEIENAWKSVGVECVTKSAFYGNIYKINGKEVSQQKAWEHAEQVVGKHLERSDWDW